MSDSIENVLILQGGGSLGAFGCGVFKSLVKNDIKIDILAGTSIGALNATIIAGSKEDHPEQALEQFWLELAECYNNINSSFINTNSNFPFVDSPPFNYSHPDLETKSILSFYNSAIFGNKKSLPQDGMYETTLQIHSILHRTNGPIYIISPL